MYVLCKHIGVCCEGDVIVVYDVIDRWMETIRSVDANSLEL